MANGQLKRILRRRPEVDEAEFELLQSRVLARLQGTAVDGSPDADLEREVAGPDEMPDTAVGVMADPGSDAWREPVPVMSDATGQAVDAEAETVERSVQIGWLSAEPVGAIVEVELVSASDSTSESAAMLDLDAAGTIDTPPETSGEPGFFDAPVFADDAEDIEAVVIVEPVEVDAIAVLPVVEPGPVSDPAPDVAPAAAVAAAPTATPKRRPARPRAQPTPVKAAPTRRPSSLPHQPAAVAGPAPYCPYCALLLEPPPESSRRCTRCRERIIVKHVDGRAVYLTEASVAIFEAERRRVANSGRWTKERGRWLKAAAAVDAPPEKIARLERVPLSDEVVASSRSLYFTTVDRAFRAAKRERRWEDASRIMREHALVLFKLAGSPIPPPEESLDAHRLGAAAQLRGLGEMSRVAELVSGKCCDACRADDGGLFKVAVELRQPRLPHGECPRGLCRCDWFLAVRDQSLVRRQLRRRARTESAVRGSS